MNSEINKEARQAAADLLQSILEGNVSAADAIDTWPLNLNDELVEQVGCLLYHFRDDENIRSKVKGYADWQLNEFRFLLVELQQT